VVIQSAFGDSITAIAVSGDATLLASAEDYIGGLKIWDLGSGLQLRTVRLPADAHALAFLPGGGLVVALTDLGVVVYDPISGQPIRELQTRLAPGFSIMNLHPGLAVARDGRVVAGGFARSPSLAPIPSTGPGALAGAEEIFKLARVLWCFDSADGRIAGVIPLPTGGSALVTAAAFSPRGGQVVAGLDEGSLFAWAPGGAKTDWQIVRGDVVGDVHALAFSPDGRRLAVVNADGSLKLGTADGRVLQPAADVDDVVGLASDHRGRLLTSGRSGALTAWDWRTGRRLGRWQLAPGLSHMASLAGGRTMAVVMGGVIGLWDVERERVVRRLGERVADIGEAVVAGGSRTLLIDAGDRLARWHVAADDYVRGPTAPTRELRELRAVPDGRTALRVRQKDDVEWSLEAIDVATLGVRWSKRYGGKIESPRASPDGRHCGVLVGRARVEVVRCEDGRAVEAFDVRQRADVVYDFDFEPMARGFSLVTSGYGGGWTRIDRFVTGQPAVQPGVDTRELGPVTNVRASPLGRWIAWSYPEGDKVKILDMTASAVAEIDANGRIVEPSPVEPLLAIGAGDGEVVFWDMGERLVLDRKALAPSIIDRLAWSPDGRLLVAGARDGSIHLLNPRKRMATVFFAGDARLVVTDEGYYMGQPAATPAVAFRVGARAYPFEQFDVTMHRPDVVMERLGGSADVLAAYRSLVRERLRRMGVAARSVAVERPTLTVDRASVPGVTRAHTLVLRLEARSPTGLRALHVFVDHVPILGARGRPLEVPADTVWRGRQAVELRAPTSKIQVAVEAADGTQSLMETFEVAYTGDVRPGVRHVVAIGVSRYADADMNLGYPAKDAGDIGALLAGAGTPTILPDATEADIRRVREALLQTAPADEVVLFVAGHGVLDDALEYRFATSDFDFARSSGGLTFAELEGLLDGIPARRKLLLMDTCHAGELDEDDVAALNRRTPGLRARALPDTRGASANPGSRGSLRTSVLAELFVDVRRGAGATVIAAAGGADLAYESERWQNGAFTRAVREGLGCGHADADGDGTIRVSELVAFAGRRVRELTHDAQRPLARRFNTADDFALGTVPKTPPAYCASGL